MLVAVCLIVATVATMLAVHASRDRAVLLRSAVLVLLLQISVLVVGRLLSGGGRVNADWAAPVIPVIAIGLIVADTAVCLLFHLRMSLWPAVNCAAVAFLTPLLMPWVWMPAGEVEDRGDALLAGAGLLALYCALGGGATVRQCRGDSPSRLVLAAACSLCSLAATLCAVGLVLGPGVGADIGGFVVWIALYFIFGASALFAGVASLIALIMGYARLWSEEIDGPVRRETSKVSSDS